jgi:hypothetical protein
VAGTSADPLTPTWRGKRALAVAASVSAILFLAWAALSSSFGVTWDFGQTAFYGERYARFYETLDSRYLDFGARAIDYPPAHPDLEPGAPASPKVSAPHFVWPLPFTLAALGCQVLCMKLGAVDFHAAHHLVNFVLAAVLIVMMVFVAGRRLGLPAAALGVLFLAAQPAFFGNLFNNLRDVPMTCLFGLALLAAVVFAERGRLDAWIAFALATGAGLACKTPAVFVLPIAFVVVGLSPQPSGRERKHKLGMVLAAGVAAILVFVALWPWLWADPWHRLLQHLDFIRQQRNPDDRFHWQPLLEAVGTMPVVTLALGVLGLGVLACDRPQRPFFLLLLLWIVVPLARICLPRARNYGGIRHFLEFLPAFALCAGVGGAWILRRLQGGVRTVVAALVILATVWPAAAAHPFQTSYCNFLVGGVSGARRLGLTAAYDFWGNSLRRGIAWLDEHAPPDSSVVVPVGDHLVKLVSGTWLRRDIAVVGPRDALDVNRRGPVYTLALARAPGDPQDRMPWVARLTDGPAAFTCRLQGETLLAVHELGAPGAAAAALSAARAAHRAELERRLPALEAAALAHPELEAVLDYLLAVKEVNGENAAREALERLLPRITDPVLREKLMRGLLETEPRD